MTDEVYRFIERENLIEHKDAVVVGVSGGADSVCLLLLLLAYHPAERPVFLTDGFDNSYYPPLENVPRPFTIVRANQYMVNKADSIICYVKHPGNTRNLIEYAQRRQKKGGFPIENVAENS